VRVARRQRLDHRVRARAVPAGTDAVTAARGQRDRACHDGQQPEQQRTTTGHPAQYGDDARLVIQVWTNGRVSKRRVMERDDPSAVRQQLELLRIEHQLAVSIGLDADPEYMADLERQLEIWEAAWVGAAVTQLAVRRAELRGRPQG
jgi:hypothetical protein